MYQLTDAIEILAKLLAENKYSKEIIYTVPKVIALLAEAEQKLDEKLQ